MRCQCCKKVPGTTQIRDIADWRTSDNVVVCDICAKYVVTQFLDPAMPIVSAREALARGRELWQLEQSGKGPSEETAVQELVLEDESDETKMKGEPDYSALSCSHCGLEFDTFRKEGRFACAHCVDAFEEPLKLIFFRIQGEAEPTHKGRRPGQPTSDSRSGRRLMVHQLQRQMQAAVEAEVYERAAQLRDQIATLERELAMSTPDADARREGG